MSNDSAVHKRRLRNFLLDPRFQLKYATLIALTGGLLFGVMGGLFYTQVRVSTEIASLDQVDARALPEPAAAPDAPKAGAPDEAPAGFQVEAEPIEVVDDGKAVRRDAPPAGDQGAFEEELQARLAADDAQLRLKLLVCWAVLVVMLFILGILVTHRIVGPLYVVDRYLARIVANEPVRFRPLRKGDEFQALLLRVKELAGQLDRERTHDVDTIEKAVEAVRALTRGADPDAVSAALAPLETLAADRAVRLVGPDEAR